MSENKNKNKKKQQQKNKAETKCCTTFHPYTLLVA